MVPEAADEFEAPAAVVAAEQRGGLHAGIDHIGRVVRAWRELPDALERSVAVRGEGEWRALALGPGGAEIIRAPEDRTPVVADRADEQARRGRPEVDARGVGRLTGERRSGEVEVVPPGGGAQREQALRRPDEDECVRGRGLM
jgi:hypothetical protein